MSCLLQFLQTTSADTLQSFTVCTVLPQRRHFPWKKASASSFLGEALFGRYVFGLASVLRFQGVPLGISLYGVCFFVALLLATFRPVPPLHLFPDELPCDPDTMATQLLPELRGAAEGDEHHRHNFLLGDVVEVAFVGDIQYSVGIRYHSLALFLRELEELHSSRVQGVSFSDPIRYDVHARGHLVLVWFRREHGCVVADEIL